MSERTVGRAGLRDWLVASPDATGTPAQPTAAATQAAKPQVGATASGRLTRAQRRAGNKRAFYAARRGQAGSPAEAFKVAADQVRALDDDRALTEATTALDHVIARFTR